MKTLTCFFVALLSSTAFAVDEPGIRTVDPAQLNEVRRQMLENGVRVIGTVVDKGQAHIIAASCGETGRFGLQPLAASELTWIRDAWHESASLDTKSVYSIDERPPTLTERWQAAQSVIDAAKAKGHPVAEAERLLEQAKRWMTEDAAIAAINAATDADLGLTQQRAPTSVAVNAATGLYYDFVGDPAPDPEPVGEVMTDLTDLREKWYRLTFNYWVGRVHITVALVDGGDSSAYHMTAGMVDKYKLKILVSLSYLSRVAMSLNIPTDWVLEYVSNNPTGTVRVQETPVKRSSGKQFQGSSNVADWINWVAASQGHTAGGTAAYNSWVNGNRRQHWANHAAIMLVPYTAGYDNFGLGLGDGIFWANYQDYPAGWEVDGDNDRDVSGYYSVVGTGSDPGIFTLAFAHELLHHPNASDLAWYACTDVPSCEKRYGENRRVNNNCEECSGAPQDSSLMHALRMNWDLDQSTLAMIGWTRDGTDYWPNSVDSDCPNYWLYHRSGFAFGVPVTFAVMAGDGSAIWFMETVIATEYTAVLSPFTGQVSVGFDGSNETMACLSPGSWMVTFLNWDEGTLALAPNLELFTQTSPSVQVTMGATGVRVGLLNFLGHLSVEILRGPSLVNGEIFLGHPTTRTWYEFPIHASLLPGTYTVRVKGAFAYWDGTWEYPVVIGPGGLNVPIGDLNVNFEPYEVADAVLFSRYFIEGLGVFDPLFLELHTRVSEVNRDGTPLSVADLVYLIRVMSGDAPPLAKIASQVPSSVAYVWIDAGEVWLETPVELAGLAMTFIGVSSDPDVQLSEYQSERKGDTLRCLAIDQDRIRTMVPAGRTLVARFQRADKPSIAGMSASTQDGAAVQLIASRPVVPYALSLEQNYPNPFNAATVIRYALPSDREVELVIYNLLGQRIRVLEQGYRIAGNHAAAWDGTDSGGRAASSGVYFYALESAGHGRVTKRMLFLK